MFSTWSKFGQKNKSMYTFYCSLVFFFSEDGQNLTAECEIRMSENERMLITVLWVSAELCLVFGSRQSLSQTLFVTAIGVQTTNTFPWSVPLVPLTSSRRGGSSYKKRVWSKKENTWKLVACTHHLENTQLCTKSSLKSGRTHVSSGKHATSRN